MENSLASAVGGEVRGQGGQTAVANAPGGEIAEEQPQTLTRGVVKFDCEPR
ncbi:MAG: hypothetical protein ACAF41_34220 (plasmid) [Leptolyngbya sp. BL-A-14]